MIFPCCLISTAAQVSICRFIGRIGVLEKWAGRERSLKKGGTVWKVEDGNGCRLQPVGIQQAVEKFSSVCKILLPHFQLYKKNHFCKNQEKKKYLFLNGLFHYTTIHLRAPARMEKSEAAYCQNIDHKPPLPTFKPLKRAGILLIKVIFQLYFIALVSITVNPSSLSLTRINTLLLTCCLHC